MISLLKEPTAALWEICKGLNPVTFLFVWWLLKGLKHLLNSLITLVTQSTAVAIGPARTSEPKPVLHARDGIYLGLSNFFQPWGMWEAFFPAWLVYILKEVEGRRQPQEPTNEFFSCFNQPTNSDNGKVWSKLFCQELAISTAWSTYDTAVKGQPWCSLSSKLHLSPPHMGKKSSNQLHPGLSTAALVHLQGILFLQSDVPTQDSGHVKAQLAEYFPVFNFNDLPSN